MTTAFGQVTKLRIRDTCYFDIEISNKIKGDTLKMNGYRLAGVRFDSESNLIFIRSVIPKTFSKSILDKDYLRNLFIDVCKINEFTLQKIEVIPVTFEYPDDQFTVKFIYIKKKK